MALVELPEHPDLPETPKQRGDRKDDQGKPLVIKGFLNYFPRAVIAVARISEFGATKYEWNGFSAVENAVERYAEAEIRHLLYEIIEGEGSCDKESELMHKAHKAWNAMAELELFIREQS